MTEQRKKLLGLAGVAFFFITLGSLLAFTTLLEPIESQWQQRVRIIASLLSLGSGILVIEMGMRISIQRFNEAFAKHERELGRPLTLDEREEVKRITHAAMANAKGPDFNAPMMRLVARISLVIIPAVLFSTFVIVVGSFLAGIGIALLFNALTGRVLDDKI